MLLEIELEEFKMKCEILKKKLGETKKQMGDRENS